MKENILEYAAEFAEKTATEIYKLKKTQCSKCYYFSRGSSDMATTGMCDFIHLTGRMRGCSPFDCVKSGIYRPAKRNRMHRVRNIHISRKRGG